LGISCNKRNKKAAVSATTISSKYLILKVVGEAGLEPAKAKPADLQSAPFAARDTPPKPPHCIDLERQSALLAGWLGCAGFMGMGLRRVNGELFCDLQRLVDAWE
jgi:hypothetical protein